MYFKPKNLINLDVIGSYLELSALDPGSKPAHSHAHSCIKDTVTDSDNDA